ncbi:MAG: hypothetical protein IJU68_03905 [Bacteroidales bacterium]|nr:hypothetical protein [Bacteroidales bacterium]
METNKHYVSPAVLEDVHLEMENRILAQSVVTEDTEVESAGQQIEDHMMTGYDHSWQ